MYLIITQNGCAPHYIISSSTDTHNSKFKTILHAVVVIETDFYAFLTAQLKKLCHK